MKYYRKYLVIGIIILFVGASVMPICNVYMDAELNYQINHQDVKDNSYATTTDFMGKNWTWMFYDDEDFNNAFEPLEDFAEEAYSGENLDVIVLQDTNYGPAKIWYINENHELDLLEEWGEVDMGDSQTLQDFLEYGKTNYPATRYILSMYDHGNAWKGACIDDTNGGWLTMNDMQQALTNTNGVDIICFTAPCGMGALESAYELKDCVEVYIGSEASSGYGHWRGTIAGICNMLNNNSDLSIIEIGEQIIQSIENNTIWPDSVTMSAIRTDQLEELANSIDTIAYDFINNFNFSNIWSVYGNVQSFGYGFVIDAYDFAEECLLVETNQSICQHLENVMNHVSEVVIAECHGNEYPDANGLNIYFPYPPEYSYDSRYADPDYELDFSQNTFWDEFLIDYLYTVFYATQDIPISNSGIINDYTATMHSCDLLVNVYEGVTEMESKGKPSDRYSFLKHKWTIDATGGYESYVFYLEAYHTANSEGDDFIFAYSTDDTTYTDMVTVTKTTDDDTYQTFTLPDTLSGTVYIRVKDGDQTKGNRFLDTIYIDHMYIEAISGPDVTPPIISNVESSVSDNTWTKMDYNTIGGTLKERENSCMVYDSVNDCFILFGGSGYLNDTWEYNVNTNTWLNRTALPTYGEVGGNLWPRSCHNMVYDSNAERVIMFGGFVHGIAVNETWVYSYSDNKWYNMTPSMTVSGGMLYGRDSPRMAYDSSVDRTIMFGGVTGATTPLNDTWEYNFNTNTWTNLNPGVVGGILNVSYLGFDMVYDSNANMVIKFGEHYPPGTIKDFTWAYNYSDNKWYKMNPTFIGGSFTPRVMHEMVYNSGADCTILFGGNDGTDAPYDLNDTWAYNYSEDTWYNLSFSQVGSDFYPRECMCLAYDSYNDKTVVACGWNEQVSCLNDTWVLNMDDYTATITWTTNEPADSVINYGNTTALGLTISDSALVTEHKIVITDVIPGITYYFEVQSTDEAGNTATDNNNGDYYTVFTEKDTTPPVITNVQSSGITHNSATITWGTDENSNSRVNYGTTTALGDTEFNSAMVTSHSIVLSDLIPETAYYYEVQSTDGEGNTATDDNNSNYYTFTTEQASSNVMHVYSIDMWYEPVKKRYNIYTKVKIVDGSNNVVEGATVYLETTLPNGDTISTDDITDSSGFVMFHYGPTPKTGTYISTVTNVAKDDWTYNPDDNVETSDSLVVP